MRPELLQLRIEPFPFRVQRKLGHCLANLHQRRGAAGMVFLKMASHEIVELSAGGRRFGPGFFGPLVGQPPGALGIVVRYRGGSVQRGEIRGSRTACQTAKANADPQQREGPAASRREQVAGVGRSMVHKYGNPPRHSPASPIGPNGIQTRRPETLNGPDVKSRKSYTYDACKATTGTDMFRVKICGITNVGDARVATDAGADAIGLNFYSASPRFCGIEQARAISQNMPQSVCKVGVFVNATPAEIRATFDTAGLDAVQLHGDESPELLRELRGLPVIRAFRVGRALAPVGGYLQACHRLACVPRMVLVDTLKPGQYGGTGATLDWRVLQGNRQVLQGVPLVLAGGLKPSNVVAAIAAVRPWAVDTASGVESSPGKKSPALVREFVEAAQAGFAQLSVRK
jgi:phosphoribosylanthranilate isomerase